ncbi:Tetratricopeptide repeat protein 23 [Bulinus truncatus]|nr:Tetratricopeptide repeat protein 23 [Bulinus truncatus]
MEVMPLYEKNNVSQGQLQIIDELLFTNGNLATLEPYNTCIMADEEPVPLVVEISRPSREAWGPTNNHSDDNDEDVDTDSESAAENHVEDQVTQPTSFKPRNGQKKVDMTTPEEKLKQAEKLAKQYSSKGKADKSIRELIKSMAFSRIIYGPSHWKYAQSIANLAEGYLTQKSYNVQAEYHADTARSIMLHGSHLASSMEEKASLYAVLIQIYRILGQASTALKKYLEAEQALQKADKILQERAKLSCVTDRECNLLDILLYQCMARLYAKEKKHALACEKYDKILELMSKEYGKDSFQCMQTYTEYGQLEQSKGKYANHDKVIELFLKAHSIASAVHREGHPDLIDTALNLSLAHAGTGMEEYESSALSYMEDCLRSCTTIHGPNNAKTLEVQEQFAKMLLRMDKTSEAMQILQSSLPSRCEVFGDYSEQVADTHKLIASVHLAQGNIEKALLAYKKCYTIESLLLGKNHRKTKDTQRTMDILLSNPSLSHTFILNKEDKLLKRPRFYNVVGRTK